MFHFGFVPRSLLTERLISGVIMMMVIIIITIWCAGETLSVETSSLQLGADFLWRGNDIL